MRNDAILTALAERDRWKRREEDATGDDREKVRRQVAYYEALVADMKKEVRPTRLRDFFRAFSTLFRF